jgi:hypothetical protein
MSPFLHLKTDTKRLARLGIPATIALALALLLGPVPPASGADSGSMVFESLPDDGHLRLSGSGDWDALKSWQGPADLYNELDFVKVNTRPDVIYRGFLYFDTSALPDDVDISRAVLHIYAKCTGDLDDTGLYILGGKDDYPHQPLIAEDFALPAEELPVCAKLDAGGWTHELAYRDITLDGADKVVRTSGTTKLVLLERRDYENDPPPDLHSENELKLYSYEEGEGFRPYLEVFWGPQQSSEPEEPVTANPTPGATPGAASNATAGSSGGTTRVALGIFAIAAVAVATAVLLRRQQSTAGGDKGNSSTP